MRPRARHSILALIGLAAATAVILPIYANAGPGVSPQAPDLRADPVGFVQQPAVYADDDVGPYGSGRLLVRFDGYVTNVGQGPLEVSGNPQIPGDVKQRARTAPGGPVGRRGEPRGPLRERRRARPLPPEARDALLAVDPRQDGAGRCRAEGGLLPVRPRGRAAAEPAPGPGGLHAGRHALLRRREPRRHLPEDGHVGGWRDVYEQFLAYQWVDVSNTAPGVYVVGSEADPDNVIWEGGGAAEVNPPAFADGQPVTVPGWIAQPVSVPQTGR